MEVEGKRVLVVGAGRSGLSAAELLAKKGAVVTVNDTRPLSELGSQARHLADSGVDFVAGSHPERLFRDPHVIVLSPGVPASIGPLRAARSHGIPIISEVELAGFYLQGRLIGVTGSNGKTTTTALTGELVRSSGVPTLVGGNIGTPLSSLVDRSTPETWSVVELSSFQLETTEELHFDVSVITNITPDHLDRYDSFDEYVNAKRRILDSQRPGDRAVLNAADPVTTRMIESRAAPASMVYFSIEGAGPPDRRASVYVRTGSIYSTLADEAGSEREAVRLDEIAIPGRHNVENVMASLGAALCAVGPDADLTAMRDVIRGYRGVEHRIELIATVGGVRFFNDSKATNVDSTARALEAFAEDIVLILGGKDKGGDFSALAPLIRSRVRHVILVGEAADRIESQLMGLCLISRAATLDQAVNQAAEAAKAGDTVLLSPACASFDMFENFEHRGRCFREAVLKLAAGAGGCEG